MSKTKKSVPLQLDLPLGEPPEEAEAPVVAPALAAPPVAEVPVVARAEAVAPSPAASARPGFRVIQGGGKRIQEPLKSRDAVVRVLVEAGADLLLRRITPERAEYIERSVEQILQLFDRVDDKPQLMPLLRRHLDELEALMTETRAQRSRRPG